MYGLHVVTSKKQNYSCMLKKVILKEEKNDECNMEYGKDRANY